MFLKSLDIFGFKSFADRTHIDFSDGITALLGPNGCGKSNVVDAIKWVLAESRSKNLRAEKKEDVIFSGTERRAALNVAEVTLTMSNEEGLLPLEEPEIAIKRRLYRSGENEYFINNRLAGAKEVVRLFLDTGVGKSAYSVMEQGKIDQILSSRPEDRRYLFEEAAGISRSKAECAVAERELEQTRRNMQQIEASLAEIKRSYDSLKVQSEKTNRYRAVRDEIFRLELDIALLKMKGFVQDKARCEAELSEVSGRRDSVRREIEEISGSISESMDKVKEMQESVYSMQAELIGLQKERNGKIDLVKQCSLRAREIKEKIGQLEARQKSARESVDGLQEEIDAQEAELYAKARQLEDIGRNIASFEQSISSAGAQIGENDIAAAEGKERLSSLAEVRAALQKELAAITEDIVAMLDSRLKDAGFSVGAMQQAAEALSSALGRLKVQAEGRRNVFFDLADAGGGAAEDGARIARDAAAAFDETARIAGDLEDALLAYQNASPAFIMEFLSPEGIMTKKRGIDAKIRDNGAQCASLERRIEELHAENAGLVGKIDECKETLGRLKVNQVQMKEQIAAAEQQAGLLRRSLASEKSALRSIDEELFEEGRRSEDLDGQILEIQGELAEIEQKGMRLAEDLRALDGRIAEGNSSVSGKRGALQKKQEEQGRLQSQFERLTLSLNTSDLEIRSIRQNFQDQHSRDLMEFEERMYKITGAQAELRERLSSAREEQRSLGQVNFMAPEEFAEVRDRYERQKANYDDTQKSLDNLIRVSEEIKSKSSELFLETYNKIKRNFHNMFRRLFNGGRAELRLENPQDILASGIEILAQPPGKKLESIALLSGGEKTMTAVALLFATYQVRPSPFCLLDEIDAALDDKNVSSFVTMLEAFSNVSQYIVITHNKKTVQGANTMLGITMEESGVSKIIALRLGEDIKVGAKIDGADDGFVEEDVPPEEGAFIPPRPQKRIYNPDGTVTDPELERIKIEERRREAQERLAAAESKRTAPEAEGAGTQVAEKGNAAEI